jgi:hypothetical protein
MAGPKVDECGSATWVAARLARVAGDDDWPASMAGRELVEWMYAVVRRRAGGLDLPAQARADVAQDAMGPIVAALQESPDRLAAADNPAAVLERVAAWAVSGGRHRVRMAGLGGVPSNGRNWRASYPRQIGGEAARRIVQDLPVPTFAPCRAVDLAADRVAVWVRENVEVELSADAVHALVYVLERLISGISRPVLLRGSHSGLAEDPAMRHLGFTPAAARAYGAWLLGRTDPGHNAPSVIDVALGDEPVTRRSVMRWRRTAVRFGFATALDSHEPAVDGEQTSDAALRIAWRWRPAARSAPPCRTE